MIIYKKGTRVGTRRFTCPECECEFEANSKEFHAEYVDGIRFYFCTCPWCNNEVKNYD